jgi:hypothetical protein
MINEIKELREFSKNIIIFGVLVFFLIRKLFIYVNHELLNANL